MAIGYLTTGTSATDRIQNTLPVAAYSTGNFEWIGCIALPDWEAGSFLATACGHHRGQISVRVRGNANNGDPSRLQVVYHNGTALTEILPASSGTFPDGLTAYQWVWARAVFNPNNGSNLVYSAYYSLDDEETAVGSVSWTQMGTTLTTTTDTVRAATSAVAGVGGDSTMTGSNPNNARFAVAQLSLNGSLTHSPDLRTGAQGWASPPATDGQSNSWSINGAAAWQAPTADKLVGRTVHYDLANKTLSISSGI